MKISEDQNTITLDNGRELNFIEVDDEEIFNSNFYQCDNCTVFCLRDVPCKDVPCSDDMRNDGRNGYFKYIK